MSGEQMPGRLCAANGWSVAVVTSTTTPGEYRLLARQMDRSGKIVGRIPSHDQVFASDLEARRAAWLEGALVEYVPSRPFGTLPS